MIGLIINAVGILIIVVGTETVGLAPALVAGLLTCAVGLLITWEELS